MSSARQYKICVIPGDGIGPDIVDSACQVLAKAASLEGFTLAYTTVDAGGAAYDKTGHPLPEETVTTAKNSDAILLGAVGGPQWDKLDPALRPEQALLGLRKELGLYANLRPAVLYQPLAKASPLKPEITERGIDMLIVRELTGGMYFGEHKSWGENETREASDIETYSYEEIARITEIAFDQAMNRRRHLTLVDKANVLASSRLWREVAGEIAVSYPEVTLDYMYVDNASMQLVKRPYDFDVILTSNMFGDILSDEAGQITGSVGLLPSASLGKPGTPGMYEPIHGSAPDIAGQNKANPLATILSAAMMLRISLKEEKAATRIENAVNHVLNEGWRTADLAYADTEIPAEQILGTIEITEKVLARV